VPNVFNLQVFEDGFQQFMRQYKSWLLATELEPEVHPWAKFQQPVPSVERMINTEESWTLLAVIVYCSVDKADWQH